MHNNYESPKMDVVNLEMSLKVICISVGGDLDNNDWQDLP